MTDNANLLPVVAGQGGNAGAQSLAVVMRGIFMREISKDKFFHITTVTDVLGFLAFLGFAAMFQNTLIG